MTRDGRTWALLVATVALMSCQPADRDIRVIWKGDTLMVDFPWSFWRLVGLQDRTYCVYEIELFDRSKVHWRQKVRKDDGIWIDCLDVQMPIEIGAKRARFMSEGKPQLIPGVRYGIGINGIGDGRVDFVFRKRGDEPATIRGWDKVMRGPCGSYWGKASCYRPISE